MFMHIDGTMQPGYRRANADSYERIPGRSGLHTRNVVSSPCEQDRGRSPKPHLL